MKLLNEENDNQFKPFELRLLIETEEEARLLYYVFTKDRLRDAIFQGNHYDLEYIEGIAKDFNAQCSNKIKSLILSKLPKRDVRSNE